MTDVDKREFAAIMALLGVAFDAQPSKERMAIYWEALRRCSLPSIQWAAQEAIVRLEFFPKVKQLLDLAGIAPQQLRAVITAVPDEVKQLEILTPPEEARAMLAELAAKFNDEMGTSFVVGEELGRPKLVSIRGGKR